MVIWSVEECREFSQKEIRAYASVRKVMEQQERKGFKGFRNKFGSANDRRREPLMRAACRTMREEFGGASEQQKVLPLGILRPCHVDRC